MLREGPPAEWSLRAPGREELACEQRGDTEADCDDCGGRGDDPVLA